MHFYIKIIKGKLSGSIILDYDAIDWEQERKAFKVTESTIYLINSGTTPLHIDVWNAERNFLDKLYYHGEESWDDSLLKVHQTRELVGKLISAEAADIGFSINTSTNMGLLAQLVKSKSGLGKFLIYENEFPASYIPWSYCGFTPVWIKAQNNRALNVNDFIAHLNQEIKVVVVSYVQFLTGDKLDLVLLGAELKKRNILFIVNATQALGQFPFSVVDAAIDAMVATTHKRLGTGYGTSIIYCSKKLRQAGNWPLAGHMSFNDPEYYGKMDNAKSETSFVELGTPNFLVLLGLRVSLLNIDRLGVDNIAKRIAQLSNYLISGLNKIKINITHPSATGIISFQYDNEQRLLEYLKNKQILVNARRGYVRISLHYYNDVSDIDKLIIALKEYK